MLVFFLSLVTCERLSPRLSETARCPGKAPPGRRLPAGQPGLAGRCSGLALGHGHGHHLHLLRQLGGWLLCVLLALLPLLSFFLTFLQKEQKKTERRKKERDVQLEQLDRLSLCGFKPPNL